jgi:hypothetical protein
LEQDHVKMDFDRTIVLMTMVGNMVDFGKEMRESIERSPANLKESLEARLPSAPMSLESYDVGLTFQLKMLEFMDFMNQ